MVPVHFSARYGTDFEVEHKTRDTVKFFMENMENPFLKDNFGNTILHHSILNEEEEVRHSLFEYLVTLNMSRSSRLGLIKKAFNFSKLLDIPNCERNYGLHIACERNHPNVIGTMIRHGHDIEVINMQMRNALHIAADRKHLKCVTAILENFPENANYEKVISKQESTHDFCNEKRCENC